MPALFDILNSINNKTPMTKEIIDREYPAFMVNRGLSYHMDSVLFANEMNMHAETPGYGQYLFLYYGVPKKKRYGKWHKKTAIQDVDVIKEYYNYSDAKAEEALEILTPEQIVQIKQRLYKGGKS